MPIFTIESSYRVLVYRQRNYEADTLEEACRLGIEDDDWSEQEEDFDSSSKIFVTGAWPGADMAYRPPSPPNPSQFGETLQRKADHFETLLGVLKILAEPHDPTPMDGFWHSRARAAIAKAEAIITGARDPD